MTTHEQQLAYRRSRRKLRQGIYDGTRCPVHGEAVGFYDGQLVGRCSGCASDAASAFKKLRAMRRMKVVA